MRSLWSMTGFVSPVVVMRPNLDEAMFVLGFANSAWLKRLKHLREFPA